MDKSVDQSVMREMNRSLALHLLRFHGPLSRTQIAHQTGLNKATITALIGELIELGYVTEVGRGHSHAGRRPVLLEFSAAAGAVLAIDIGVDYIKCAVTDLAANIITTKEVSLPDKLELSNLLDICLQMIDSLQMNADLRARLRGVGVAVPGLVDHESGVVLNAPNLGWRDVPLRALLEDRLRLPVFVDNEANIGALAEKRYGQAGALSDFIYISAGMGIGTGIIANGKPLRGVSGMAGEFGHTIIDLQGPKCSCGNRGCLEVYASERALLKRYEKATGKKVDFTTFCTLLQSGDEAAKESVTAVAGYLAIGILNMLHTLNPSTVLLGNQLGKIGAWLIPPIIQLLVTRSLTAGHVLIDVRASGLAEQAGLIGAAALAIDEYFSAPRRTEPTRHR